jgi:hypothetical protein
VACRRRKKTEEKKKEMKNISAFKLVKETAEVSETSTNLEKALETLIAAAHGEDRLHIIEINEATKLVQRLLLKDNRLKRLLRVEFERARDEA